MRKEILFVAAFLLLGVVLMTIVSAGDVDLEIITYANYEVSVNIINPDLEEPIHYLVETSGSNGKANFNFSVSLSKVDISVIVRKNGKIVVFKKFEDISPTGPISLKVLKEDNTPTQINDTNQTALENSTQINDTNQTEQTEPATNISQTTTGETTFNEEPEEAQLLESPTSVARIIFYTLSTIFLAFIIIGLILFFVFRKKMAPTTIKIKKYSEMKKEAEGQAIPTTEDEKKLQELESKIKKLQGEIDEIRNRKTKIREAEEKLKRDMEELEKLKKAAE